VTDELADIEGQMPVEHALAGGEPQRVGWFRFYFADERWEWSPQVQRMHGYEVGTVQPTTDLVLSHKHPDDYGQVAATLEEIRLTSGAFSTRHRIVDTRVTFTTWWWSATRSSTTPARWWALTAFTST